MLRLALLTICLITLSARAQHQTPPNIILIVADDLGWGELGCYGQQKLRTPNIDSLAARGVRFTRFYSGAPVCAPSRAVLLTGKHPGHAAIRDNKEIGGWGPEQPEGQWPLPASEATIAEYLKRAGYTTGAFGKWGLGGPGSQGHLNPQGFNHFYGYLCQRVAHNYYPTHLWRNHDVDVLHNNDFFRAHQRVDAAPEDPAAYDQYKGGDFAPQAILDEALDFIENNADRPFFLYYPTMIPHVALQAPQEYIDRFPEQWDQEPYFGQRGYLPTPRPRATYAAMIAFLDDAVGRILDSLDAHNLTDNTLIVFTSDNGASYAGGVDMAFFNSVAGLRGRKGDLYEGGIRVPMIAAWPGRIPEGTTSNIPAAFWDLLPTLCDAAELPTPTTSDGLSLLPWMTTNEPPAPPDRTLYWEFPGYAGQQAAMWDTYKAIRRNMQKGNLTIAIYDLEADPAEQTDLAESRPDLVRRAEMIFAESHTESPTFPLPPIDN